MIYVHEWIRCGFTLCMHQGSIQEYLIEWRRARGGGGEWGLGLTLDCINKLPSSRYHTLARTLCTTSWSILTRVPSLLS